MIAVVKVTASGEPILEHKGSIYEVTHWLRSFGLQVQPALGWVNADLTRHAAIYREGGMRRAVIWLNT